MFVGRRPTLILALGVLLAVAGCTSAPVLHFPLTQWPQVVMQPGDGSTGVSPVRRIWIAVRGGTFNVVGLTSPAGKAVIGQLSADRATWTVGEPLGYDKTYTWWGTAVDSDGVQMPVHGSFHTVSPTERISAKLNVGDNSTYGIAMPIALAFSSPVRDKATVERSLSVQTSVPTEGSWAWLDDRTVHWRPHAYFTPNTDVTVTARLYGLAMGDGAYGREDISARFTIGRSYVLKGDTQTRRLISYADGVQVADYAASYGLDSDPRRVTRSGTHVVMAKFPTFFMTNSRFDYYNVETHWAVQISDNGEFAHSAPWSVGQQGRWNVSHGCINLSPSAAKAVFTAVLPGDPVEITGSSQQLGPQDGDYFDWTVPWDVWVTESALHN
jgi:lipoprotein-anchoring transpeptidase ErfK/SrfK